MKLGLAWFAMLVLSVGVVRGESTGAAQEARQMLADGQAQPALQRIAQALALRSTPKAERYELLMVRGEAQLSLKASALAIDAFAAAAKEAQTDAQRMVAQAHEMLVKRSVGLSYKGKLGDNKGKSFDVIKPDGRKEAFKAMLADETRASDTRLETAQHAKTLTPILEAMAIAQNLRGLELAANGQDTENSSIVKKLAERGKTVVADAIREMGKRTDAIDKDAATLLERNKDVYENYRGQLRTRRVRVWYRKGLNDRQMEDLKEVGATCDKIPVALEGLVSASKLEAKPFEALADDAMKLRKEVIRILDTDYAREYETPPKK